jgi:hypothetical protein
LAIADAIPLLVIPMEEGKAEKIPFYPLLDHKRLLFDELFQQLF